MNRAIVQRAAAWVRVCAAVLCGAGVWAVEPASFAQPDPEVDAPRRVLGAGAPTTREVEARLAALDARLLREAYERLGVRGEAWDEPTRAFLDSVASFYGRATPRASAAAVLEAAERAVKAGCADPMVRALSLCVQYEQDPSIGGHDGVRIALRDSVRDATKAGWASHALVRAYDALWRMQKDAKDEPGQQATMADAVRGFVAGSAGTENTPDLERLLLRQVANRIEADWPVSVVEPAARADAIKSPWLREMTLGLLEERKAWDARGRGFADTVKPEGAEAFKVHMGKAAEHLRAAHALDPSRPEAASRMIRVVMSGHAGEGQSLIAWFERAIEAQADYQQAVTHTLFALRPRWWGSHPAMLSFGVMCAERGREDSTLPMAMITAVQDVIDDAGDPREPFAYEGVFDTVARVLEREARKSEAGGDVAGARWARSGIAAAAWLDGSYDAGRKVLDALGGMPDRNGAEMFRDSTDLAEDVYAFSGAGGEQITRAWMAAHDGNAEDARAEAKAALDAIDRQADPRGWEATAYQRDGIDLLLRAGEGWADAGPVGTRPLWVTRVGAWTAGEGGSWTLEATGKHEAAVMTVMVGPEVEWKGTVRFADPASTGQAGLVYHWEWWQRPQARWRVFTVSPATGEVRVGNGFRAKAVGKVTPTPDGRYDLHLSAWEDRAIARVNGEVVYEGPLEKDARWTPGDRVGVGASGVTGEVRFEGLRVQVREEDE
jgi:hypothetical protein